MTAEVVEPDGDLDRIIEELRAALAGAEPGSDTETECRKELATRLVDRYELAELDAEDPGDLDEALYHSEWSVSVLEPLSGPWIDAQLGVLVASADLWHHRAEQADLDRAIAAAEVLSTNSSMSFVDAMMGQLLVERYFVNSDRDDLTDAGELLRAALDGYLVPESRVEAEAFLGITLSEQVMQRGADGEGTIADFAEPVELLTENLRWLQRRTGIRDRVLYALGRIHTIRYCDSDFEERGGDPAAELDLAIEYLRDVQRENPWVAEDLLFALYMRHSDRADPGDRDEGLMMIRRPLPGADEIQLDGDHTEMLGEFHLLRAREFPTAKHIADAVSFLDDAVAAAERPTYSLVMLLVQAYGLLPETSEADLRRIVALLEGLDAEEDRSDDPTFAHVLGMALADLALRSRNPAELDRARSLLAGSARIILSFNWAHLAELAVLGLLLVSRHVPESAVPAWSPFHLTTAFDEDVGAEILAWLLANRDRLPAQATGRADYLAAIGLLSSQLSDRRASGAPIEAQVAVRTEVIARLTDAARVLAEDDGLYVAVRQQLGFQFAQRGQAARAPSDIEEALRIFDELVGGMAPGHLLRSQTLALLASVLAVARAVGMRTAGLGHALAALRDVAADEALEVDVRAACFNLLGLIESIRFIDGRDGDLSTAIGYFGQAIEVLPPDDPAAVMYRFHLAAVLADRHRESGDARDLDAAQWHLEALREIALTDESAPVDLVDVEFILTQLHVMRQAGSDGAAASVDDFIALLRDRQDEQAVGSPDDRDARLMEAVQLADALLLRSLRADDRTDYHEAMRLLAAFDSQQVDPLLRSPALVKAAMSCAVHAHRTRDRAVFDEALELIEHLRQAEETPPNLISNLPLMSAMAWLMWHEATGDGQAMDNAIAYYEECVRDDDPRALSRYNITGFREQFADLYWTRGRGGDGVRSIDVGLDALRRQGLAVLLQTGGDRQLAQVADTADKGTRLAIRSLVIGEPDRALRAAEAGRGLVLHTATATAGIATVLREHGHAALADEWEAAPGLADADDEAGLLGFDPMTVGAPSDLRQRLVRAIAGTPVEQRVSTPPTAAEIGAALACLDADALVYLLPQRGENGGRGLVVRPDGTLDEIALPRLRDGEAGMLGDYLAIRRAAEARDASPAAIEAWRAELAALCDRAWRVAGEAILTRATGWRLGREPRLVLVPCGELGAVPWHAASRGDHRTGTRFLVEDAVISYASSARQLIDLAGRRRRPVDDAPVVVCDPSATLIGAPVEAEFLSALYPAGRFLGSTAGIVPAAGPGTPEEVLAALNQAALLHLGCHSVSEATPSASHLVLANRARLTLERILRSAHGRAPGIDGGTIVLASCQSDLTHGVHDEALTLSSAFVAAGAATVVGARWSVNDLTSCALMCRFHLELRANGLGPREALRAAQLWALDPARPPLPHLPGTVAARLRELDLREISAWAGFAHYGW